MKIVDNTEPSHSYLTVEDVPCGTVFRFVGDDELILNVSDGAYKLSDGGIVYCDEDVAPVEIVEGYFTVTGIKNN